MPADREELLRRLKRLAEALKEEGIEAALIRYPLNIFYFAGVFADGHLVVKDTGEAFLLVYRTLGRPEKSPVAEIFSFRSLKKLPGFLRELGLKSVALEEDRLPHSLFRRYQKLLSGFELFDLGGVIREIRSVKSPYELSCLKKAAELLAQALEEALPLLRPNLSELEAAGLLEAQLRKRGHPAYSRAYGFGQELAYGHLLSGQAALCPSYVTTGQGGLGLVGFPQGPSFKELAPGEPILIDYLGWFEGYMVDQSRVFYFGSLSREIREIYQRVLSLIEELETILRPGILAREIYERALSLAEELGLSPYFMAHGPEKVPFVGHGVGLEVDEWPPIAAVEVPLKEGMVVALEPKCHLPGVGVIGIEDTYFITAQGPKRLTVFPRDLRKLNF